MSRIFFNQHAPNWDSTRSEQNTSRLRQMAGRLPLPPSATLLDVGSGTGVFRKEIIDTFRKRQVTTRKYWVV